MSSSELVHEPSNANVIVNTYNKQHKSHDKRDKSNNLPMDRFEEFVNLVNYTGCVEQDLVTRLEAFEHEQVGWG